MNDSFSFNIDAVLPQPGAADFSQFLKVLKGEEPERPTLFEFFLNPRLLQKAERDGAPPRDELA
jgi:hypothetical protein